MRDRVSLPVTRWISRAIGSQRPPNRRDSPGSDSPISVTVPPLGNAPSATTTIEKCRPAASRAMILSQTFRMSYGISGMRITSAVPATPACRAMNPASRPITSITITRSCDSAVVCSLSIASSAVLTAVSNPKVVIVPLTSLSIVFGTPTIFIPLSQSSLAMVSDPSPPIETSASMPSRRAFLFDDLSVGQLARIVERIAPVRRAEDRAAEMGDAAHALARERNDLVVAHQPGEAALDAEHLPAAVDRGEHRGADDRVESRGVAAAGRDRDPHGVVAGAARSASVAAAELGVEQRDDLARCCVAAEFRLLEYRFSIGRDLESPAARRDELDRGVRQVAANLGRQTGGPRFVVSHRAVFNRDRHRRSFWLGAGRRCRTGPGKS